MQDGTAKNAPNLRLRLASAFLRKTLINQQNIYPTG